MNSAQQVYFPAVPGIIAAVLFGVASLAPAEASGLRPLAERLDVSADASTLSTPGTTILLAETTHIERPDGVVVQLPEGSRAQFLRFTDAGPYIISPLLEEGRVTRGSFVLPDAAAELYGSLDVQSHADPDDLLMYFSAIYAQGLKEKALDVLQAACRRFPEHEPLHHELCSRLMARRSWTEALELASKRAQTAPADAHWWCAAAACHTALQDFDAAAAAVDRALLAAPASAQACLRAGYLARHQGDMAQSLKYYNQAHRAAPSSTEVLRKRAYVLAQLERYEEAIRDVCEMMSQDAGLWDAYAPDRRAWAERVIQENPRNVDAMALMAATASAREEAIRWIGRALEANNRHPVALRMQARALQERGEQMLALERAINAGFTTSDAYYDLSMYYRLAHRRDAAIRELKQCLRISPAHMDARISLGEVYLSIPEHVRALPQLDLALAQLESTPDKELFDGAIPPFYSVLALIHARRHAALKALGRLEEADEAFQLAVRASPEGRDLRTVMACALADVIYGDQPDRRYWETANFSQAQLRAARDAQRRLAAGDKEAAIDDFVRVCAWDVYHMVDPYAEKLGSCDVRDAFERSPLVMAASCGNVAVVARLLELGAAPNFAATTGGRPVRYALHESLRTRNYLVARLLLNAGADPSLKDYNGQTALEVVDAAGEQDANPVEALRTYIDGKLHLQMALWTTAVTDLELQNAKAKASLEHLTKSNAREMAKYAGMIAAVAPGPRRRRTDAWYYMGVPLYDRPMGEAWDVTILSKQVHDPERYAVSPSPYVDFTREGAGAQALRWTREKQFAYALASYRLTELAFMPDDPRRREAGELVQLVAEQLTAE